jgi:ComF family protein
MSLAAIARGLLDLLAPPRCAGCDEPLSPSSPAFCEACELLLDPGERVGSAVSAYLYGGPLADAVRRLKYGRRTELAPALGAMLAERALELSGEVDVVVPVPLHATRLRARGFNQAALLASPVARALGVPLATRELVRLRDTPPQAGLGGADRLRNVRGAFVATAAPGGRVLLVDDVRTTGATLAECAEALRVAGAEHVLTLVLARAED